MDRSCRRRTGRTGLSELVDRLGVRLVVPLSPSPIWTDALRLTTIRAAEPSVLQSQHRASRLVSDFPPMSVAERVEILFAAGALLERIALEFELTVDELCERFADTIEHGPARVNARLTEVLYRTAMRERENVIAIRLYRQQQEKGLL